ncbi:hypothetical protein H1D32_06490 [Anaerobacillus sp. CMMVII]|uniref:hypothetical protein n=1 Tax=Anaerobacillus sp. CMMVII TaxID=2755588 RepID=UPI0021B736F2|nr:hypothetical protein [Anaerobacillus sp. CMMVII]MCT8137423.1 hypothetical protein [Anaerobacillus sp. CMMVII]
MRNITITFLVFLLFPNVFTYGQEIELNEKFLPRFEEIEMQAVNKLNNLIDEAYREYVIKKEHGKATLPLLFSYVDKGNQLEKEIDLAFQSLLMELKTEIKEKGLPEDIATHYEQQYTKSKRRNKLKILKNITFEGPAIKFQREY